MADQDTHTHTNTNTAPDNVQDLLYPTYRLTEIVGTSRESVDDAIRNGLARASATLHNLDWFQVEEIRGSIGHDKAHQMQVRMKVGFRVDD